MENYKVTGRQTLWEGGFLRSLRLTYRKPDGGLRHWEAIERTNCDDIVAIVPITGNNDLILIRQFRPPVDNYVIEFPAGLSNSGESPEMAALRELREETGYEAGELVYLGKGPLSSGSSMEMLTVYAARGLKFVGIDGRDETEDIEVITVPAEEIYKALMRFSENGDYIDLKIMGLVEIARKQKLIN